MTHVTPPLPACDKCGWPVAYMPNHAKFECNPVGGKAVDELAARLEGVARVTKLSQGLHKATIICEGGLMATFVVARDGTFQFSDAHWYRSKPHSVASLVLVARFLAAASEVEIAESKAPEGLK